MSLPTDLWSAIYTKLSGMSAITSQLAASTAIYHAAAKDNATFPYIVFSIQAGGPENINPSDMLDVLYNIRAISDVDMETAGLIDAAISAALHSGTISVTGYTNFWIRRETDIAFAQVLNNGITTYTSGGLYRIRLTA